MITSIKLTDDYSIPYGNMCFVGSVPGREALYRRCVELEQSLKSDYNDFAKKLRMVIEEFVLSEESGRAVGLSDAEQLRKQREILTKAASADGSFYVETAYDLFLNSINAEELEAYVKASQPQHGEWTKTKYEYQLKEMIRNLARFASKSSHAGSKSQEMVPDEGNCRVYFKQIWSLLHAYYGSDFKYDGARVPFKDYYPVKRKLCQAFGIELPLGKLLYVKYEDKPRFYLFTSAEDEKLGEKQKRDINTIHKLWMENVDYPQNIIENIRFDSNTNGRDYCFWISLLPSFPQSLTDSFINKCTFEEKMMIVKGIVRGIDSMHSAESPFYHRSLSASSFLVCRIKDKYKPILISFDSSKDTDDEKFTVLYAVEEKVKDAEDPALVFAPELLDEKTDYSAINWEKVDIYALGRTIVKVITGKYDADPLQLAQLTDDQMIALEAALDSDPDTRPTAKELLQVF